MPPKPEGLGIAGPTVDMPVEKNKAKSVENPASFARLLKRRIGRQGG